MDAILTYGSGLGQGAEHRYDRLPTVVAGGGGGRKAGFHLACKRGMPLANLWLAPARAVRCVRVRHPRVARCRSRAAGPPPLSTSIQQPRKSLTDASASPWCHDSITIASPHRGPPQCSLDLPLVMNRNRFLPMLASPRCSTSPRLWRSCWPGAGDLGSTFWFGGDGRTKPLSNRRPAPGTVAIRPTIGSARSHAVGKVRMLGQAA